MPPGNGRVRPDGGIVKIGEEAGGDTGAMADRDQADGAGRLACTADTKRDAIAGLPAQCRAR
jgi:hypothetical protein